MITYAVIKHIIVNPVWFLNPEPCIVNVPPSAYSGRGLPARKLMTMSIDGRSFFVSVAVHYGGTLKPFLTESPGR